MAMPKHKVFRDSDSESENGDSTSFPDQIKAVEDDEDFESVESNDDAEPEAVTFKDSKKNVLDRVRFALRQIEQDKQQTKEKRRKRDAVFKEQKKQKLARLEDCRLPEEVLEIVAEKPRVLSVQPSKITQLSENGKDHADSGSSGSKEEDEAYIPLKSDVITAVNSKHLNRNSSKSQSALDFRHRKLYGNAIPREPASTILARRAKKAAARRT